jgi:hypothetical protein
MKSRYSRFAEFYPFYLSEHRNPNCRRLHFIGTSLGLALFLVALFRHNPWWVLAALATGYALAFAGHYLFEKNRPVTFSHPIYSFAGDWVMWYQILTGRLRI